jgi:FkbM family methyltransferase
VDEIDFHRALHHPGTLIDVGAHAGALTLALADLPGSQILAFEPLPPAFLRLEAAVRARWNGIPPHITLRPEALGAAPATLTLEVPLVGGAPQEQWASLVKDYEAMRAADPRIDAVRRYRVPVIPLDSLGLTNVTAMKIDAEGSEEEILLGAAKTLRHCRPVLSIEIEERHRPGSTRRVPDLMTQFGYDGFYEFYGQWRSIDAFDPFKLQRGSPSPANFDVSDPYVFCFYFVTKERQHKLGGILQ